MSNNNTPTIQVGDNVRVIVEVWREDETPTEASFYQGKITQLIARSKHAFYARVEGLDKLIPLDRARLT